MTIQELKKYYSPPVYQRGLEYFQEHRLVPNEKGALFFANHLGEERLHISCLVRGSEDYEVTFPVLQETLSKYSLDYALCDCPHFYRTESECKHIVCAMLTYLNSTCFAAFQELKGITSQAKHSSYYGSLLLRRFANTQKEGVGDVVLVPQICDISEDYPHISFTIGREKKYVVKSLELFFQNLDEKKQVRYGKELKFTHTMESFDETSQQLIRILTGQNNQGERKFNYRSTEHLTTGNRGIAMDNNSFSLFFDLFLEQEIKIAKWVYETVRFTQGDPIISLQLTKKENGATVELTSPHALQFFGDEYGLFVLCDQEFLRCSPSFSQKIAALTICYQKPVFLAEEDLPTLCTTVVTAVKDIVEVEDEEGICENFLPDPCTPCFYFDVEERIVICHLRFRYGDVKLSEFPSEEATDIRRNLPLEEEAKEFLLEFFRPLGGKYVLNVEEEQFLTQDLNSFWRYGEIYHSISLQGKFIAPKNKPSIGISVSSGILTLDMDTGDFPLEELEALYASLLRKKKYHKLKDGRFLTLDGSGLEKMAEISHMLQLSPQDLKADKITLPTYRGLYLDGVLESYDGVEAVRNQNFRRMMKDFKSLAESDFQPSEKLQTTLRPYQVLGFQWMKTLEQYGFGGILADEMGLGKTVQVITYLLSLEDKKEPSLVVCPASLLLNWGEELARFAPSLSVMLILGNAKERKAQITSKEGKQAQVWVTSYDLLKRDKDAYEGKGFYACILDEAQHIKNQGTMVSKAVKNLVCVQRYVLTGTPIENRLSELWNLFDFLMPGYLFSHHAFLNKLEKPIIQSGDAEAGKQLSNLVQPFLKRRLKKDVLTELPEKMEHLRKIHLSEEERKLYLATTLTLRKKAEETQNKLQILAMLTQLRQLCCDPNLCLEHYAGPSSKLEACVELCQSMVENQHKILLFSQFTSMLDRLRPRLEELGIRHLTIEGATSKENRAKYVKEFQNNQVDVFLISLKAGGTGLNLTNADVVIHYDPWWNQAVENQATDRAHRMGQKRHVQVYKLITQGTIEEKIVELQEKKASLLESVLEETGDTPMTRDEILDLLG